eukprot:m.92706 g.92706  ORF g.92706 m.92706 type:complete len:143 (-) comp15342_c0_seq3:225-653(-)
MRVDHIQNRHSLHQTAPPPSHSLTHSTLTWPAMTMPSDDATSARSPLGRFLSFLLSFLLSLLLPADSTSPLPSVAAAAAAGVDGDDAEMSDKGEAPADPTEARPSGESTGDSGEIPAVVPLLSSEPTRWLLVLSNASSSPSS